MKKVRCAVVGLGAIGPTHVEAITHLEETELVAVCDIVKEKAETMAAQHGCKAYDDFDTMLQDPDIDLVHICLPSAWWTPVMRRASCSPAFPSIVLTLIL